MRNSRVPAPAVLLCLVVVAPGLVSCRSVQKDPSDFCKSVAVLGSAVSTVNQSPLTKSTVAAVQDSLDQIDAAAKNLSDTAGSQYPKEVAAVERSVTALDASVKTAIDKPTPPHVQAARTSMQTMTSSVNALSTATSSSC
jgi:cell division septation protein DedD